MDDFLQTLVTAIAVGSLYALIALGYTLVYGVLRFINFAHGDVVVLGAWLSLTLAAGVLPRLGVAPAEAPIWATPLVLAAAMLACAAVGVLIERLCYRPLRGAPRLNVLITAIGVSLLLQNVQSLNIAFGTQPERMPPLLGTGHVLSFQLTERGSPVEITIVDVTILITSFVLLFGLERLVYHTRFGTQLRAISFNFDTAALMGINVDRVISATFALGSALAAAAGLLYALKYPGLNQPAHSTWVLLGLKAFVAAVVGGIGNVRGAMFGGFVIAFVEQFGALYLSSNYRDVYVFALLIIVLLVRPTGIFGAVTREKV